MGLIGRTFIIVALTTGTAVTALQLAATARDGGTVLKPLMIASEGVIAPARASEQPLRSGGEQSILMPVTAHR